MKNLIQITLFLIACANAVFAGEYESAMSAAIEKLNTANALSAYLESAAAFERIGEAEKDQWLPYYYAGLSYIWVSHAVKEGEKVDEYLEKAQFFVDKAKNLSPKNDEIVTLQGYIYMMKVVVDPPSRGPEFSRLAMQEFGRAVGMNQKNPRALLLLGKMKMGTDQFFGNDLSESCRMISNAAHMFENYKAKSAIDPAWGKAMADMFVTECESN